MMGYSEKTEKRINGGYLKLKSLYNIQINTYTLDTKYIFLKKRRKGFSWKNFIYNDKLN